ncbi:MAG: hydrogenase maturation nickel metallochaperone HypA [Agathobacter sp.]|nr:hydrogenase maturation nickel metallochaperone HypA [Agathobacter sp.]
MHEYHGAVQIIEHAEDLCRERKHNQVNKIQLLIGEASGYTFDVVKNYFEEVSVGTVCEGAEVTVRKAAVMLRCPNCNELFPKRLLQYDCPICGTPGNPTDAGKEMTIDFMESEWVEEKGDVLARVIQKQDVIEFFDMLAPSWDDDQIIEPEKINAILDYAGVKEGVSVLDVACGTGVLMPDYLERDVAKITGVDISNEMIQIAKDKFHDSRVEFICADVEEVELTEAYDVCMIYNAFPHFVNPASLIKCLSEKLRMGGRLTIAHSMSRKQLDSHHSGPARKVSMGLMHEDELAKLFEAFFDVDVKVSNDQMYVVSGVKKGHNSRI